MRVGQPGMRASDEDRQRIVADLGRHAADGRLTIGEFHDRAGRAYAATTVGDLAAVTRDLPALPPPPATPVRVSRNLVVAMSGAFLVIAVLGVLLALFRH
jgi:hypothetical protein